MIANLLWQIPTGATEAPYHVIVENKDLLPKILSLAVIIVPIATLLFNRWSRLQERRGASYQKLVVEDALTNVTKFFDDLIAKLTKVAFDTDTASHVGGNVGAIVDTQTPTINADIITMEKSILDRLGVFGFKETQEVSFLFADLRTSVSFCLSQFRGFPQSNLELWPILVDHKRNLIGLLYEREFKHFPARPFM